MKKFIAFTGVIGTIIMVLLSLFDHLMHFSDKVYFIALIVAILFMIPIMVREILSLLGDKKKD